MTTLSTRKAKRGKTSLGKPTILIGKKGSTDLIMKEISKYLDARKSVKVKILKSALLSEKAEEIAQKAAKATGSMIVQVRGHTFTLYKPKKFNPKPKQTDSYNQTDLYRHRQTDTPHTHECVSITQKKPRHPCFPFVSR